MGLLTSTNSSPNEDDPLIGSMRSTVTDHHHNQGGFFKWLCYSFFLIIPLLLIGMWPVFSVPPGTIGVVVTLGQVTAFGPGIHHRLPILSEVIYFTSKTQKLEERNSIPTKEGLTVSLDTAVLFRMEASKAAAVYQQVGEDYIDLILKPEVSSAIRGMTSESEAKALYTSGRSTIQETLKTELKQKLEPRGIIIEDVLLKDITLPTELTKAIELKAKAEQDAATMQFVLQKETMEAQRKAIEAKGIADFQRIVSEGISPELLQWKGIEATEKFADSSNSKIIIMGNDGGGLPVILSAADNGNGNGGDDDKK